jgi:hypothetical protein
VGIEQLYVIHSKTAGRRDKVHLQRRGNERRRRNIDVTVAMRLEHGVGLALEPGGGC